MCGLDLQGLTANAVVVARTKNTVYMIQVEAGGRIRMIGSPEHCPEWTAIDSLGTVLMTGEIRDRWLEVGMRMEFRVGARRVFTSRVAEVEVRR
jgi:hypothetical protein